MTDSFKVGQKVRAWGYSNEDARGGQALFNGEIVTVLEGPRNGIVRVQHANEYLLHPRQLEAVKEPQKFYAFRSNETGKVSWSPREGQCMLREGQYWKRFPALDVVDTDGSQGVREVTGE